MVRQANNISVTGSARRSLLACAALLLVGADAMAAQRFISSTRLTTDDTGATLSVEFNCKVTYVRHSPKARGDRLTIELDPTTICNGVSPQAAQSRARLRPLNADAVNLVDVEYDGESLADPTLMLNFSEPVSFSIASRTPVTFRVDIRIEAGASADEGSNASSTLAQHRQVVHEKRPSVPFVINLASFQRIPTMADAAGIDVPDGRRLFFSKALIDGATWYRLRLGDFASAEEARNVLATTGGGFPDAWIGNSGDASTDVELVGAATVAAAPLPEDGDEVDRLMAEARREIVSGNTPRAIQIYTKVLQLPPHPRHPEAQEYLAVAREKQGQLAHAKAEYQRYLSLYPNAEGAARVSQRLAAMLASDRPADGVATAAAGARQAGGAWRLQTYAAQYYRRDVNQRNEQEEIISQSALYSDINVDARRRGERFDLSARLSGGYRNDFLEDGVGSGNETRVSYAYVDIDDAVTGLRARLGRQSRNTGGVLGRFDGLELGYQLTERVVLGSVVGKPAYSANDGVDSARTFYGASVNYGPVLDGLELGLYFIQQDIEDINDRKATGFEFRYFGERQSVWGLIDYDTGYGEIGSAFLQTNWRVTDRFSLHGSLDRRRSPFLSTGNAIIGQPVEDFAQLADIFFEDELRQLALDRSPVSTTYSIGIAHSLTPNLQFNADANRSTIAATPDSGGVIGSPASEYNYLSANLVASSLFREGDVIIVGSRYSDSGAARVTTLTLDGRFPFRAGLRVNPRLRVDRRERLALDGYEWFYYGGLRLQYRPSRGFRVELEAGKQFNVQDGDVGIDDRESWFVNLGYQLFF
jgi:tetratricopeptide (TPR) repeat protein